MQRNTLSTRVALSAPTYSCANSRRLQKSHRLLLTYPKAVSEKYRNPSPSLYLTRSLDRLAGSFSPTQEAVYCMSYIHPFLSSLLEFCLLSSEGLYPRTAIGCRHVASCPRRVYSGVFLSAADRDFACRAHGFTPPANGP